MRFLIVLLGKVSGEIVLVKENIIGKSKWKIGNIIFLFVFFNEIIRNFIFWSLR